MFGLEDRLVCAAVEYEIQSLTVNGTDARPAAAVKTALLNHLLKNPIYLA
jgi:hypothetical protein